MGLQLDKLDPPFELRVIDIDHSDTPENIRELYDKEVPVMAISFGNDGHQRQVSLPRVSPRLKGEDLFKWLQRACAEALGSD